VARRLNDMTGFSDKFTLAVGSVTELPYDSESFDAFLCQNVSMNVGDKTAMFNKAFRVLNPGGIYTFSHLADRSGRVMNRARVLLPSLFLPISKVTWN